MARPDGASSRDRQTNVELLKGLYQNMLEADTIQTSVAQRLDEQTEQVRNINRDIDSVGATMDQASFVIKGMRPLGLLRQAMFRPSGQAPTKCKWMWQDMRVPPLAGEWAARKNPIRWSRWFGLEEAAADVSKHGGESRPIFCQICLLGRVKYETTFDDPGDAAKKLRDLHVCQQQAGVAFAQEPVVGLSRTRTSTASATCSASRPSVAAKVQQTPGQEEEALLADMNGLADGMLDKSRQINRALDVQNQMIGAVASKVDHEIQRTKDESGRLREMRGG